MTKGDDDQSTKGNNQLGMPSKAAKKRGMMLELLFILGVRLLSFPPPKAAKTRGIFRVVESGSPLTTSVIISRIIANRELYEKRNQAKQAKELRALEAVKRRRESEQSS